MLSGGFPLGPFMVEEDGRLAFRAGERQAGFSFQWRGRAFAVALNGRRMELSGVLGLVPSSARNRAAREAAFVLLRALPRGLPAGWGLRLMPDHRIRILAEEGLAWPANMSELMQPIVRFLLLAAPYLDLMDETGLAPAV